MIPVVPVVPVRMCCGYRHHGPTCPDGMTRCCICFGRFPVDQLAVDESGLIDVCQACSVLDQTPPTSGGR